MLWLYQNSFPYQACFSVDAAVRSDHNCTLPHWKLRLSSPLTASGCVAGCWRQSQAFQPAEKRSDWSNWFSIQMFSLGLLFLWIDEQLLWQVPFDVSNSVLFFCFFTFLRIYFFFTKLLKEVVYKWIWLPQCVLLSCWNSAELLISDSTVQWRVRWWWTVTAGHRHFACLTSCDCGAVTLTQRTLVVNFPLVSVISAESLFQPTPHSCFYCRCLECEVEAATTTRTTTATRETKRIFLSTDTFVFLFSSL